MQPRAPGTGIPWSAYHQIWLALSPLQEVGQQLPWLQNPPSTGTRGKRNSTDCMRKKEARLSGTYPTSKLY
jgi:hypothetical protein